MEYSVHKNAYRTYEGIQWMDNDETNSSFTSFKYIFERQRQRTRQRKKSVGSTPQMFTIARAGQGPNHWSHHLLTRVPISKKLELEVDLEFKSRHYDMACRQHNRCLHLNTKCALLLYFLFVKNNLPLQSFGFSPPPPNSQ